MLLFGKPESVFVFNFLTRAVPYIALGYWIHANQCRLLKYRWLNIYFILLVLMGLEQLVTLYLSNYTASPSLIGLFPIEVALFMLFLSHSELGRGTWLEMIGAKYSGNIYYFHMAVILLWKQLNPYSALLSEVYEYGGVLIVFIISLGIAWVMVKMQDKIGYHVLK